MTLEVVPPKPNEPTKELTKGLIKEQTKDQVQVGRSRSFERNIIISMIENYGPYSPKGHCMSTKIAKTEACGFRWEKAKAEMWPMCQNPAPRTVVVSQLSRAQRQYATTCKVELEWADKR
ncbi:unnamed protein product [Prunus brigantina]